MPGNRLYHKQPDLPTSQMLIMAGPIERRIADRKAAAKYAGQRYEDDPRAGTKHDAGMYGRVPTKPDSRSYAGCGLANLKGSGL